MTKRDGNRRRRVPDSPLKVGDEESHNALTARFPAENLTVLAHFYRGELARSNVWRQKMDMTTHWAVITTTALVSLAFSNPATTHLLLPLCSVLLFQLLIVESRRYRFYDVWRTRVRMLEVHMIVPALYSDRNLVEGDWREVLCNDLLLPTYKMSYWEAVGRRLARTYIFLFVIVFGAWLVKVYISRPEVGGVMIPYYDAFGVAGLIPSSVVIGVVVAIHAIPVAILLATWRLREATGEIRRKDPQRRRRWPI